MRRASSVAPLVAALSATSVVLAGHAASSEAPAGPAVITSRYERAVMADHPAAFLQGTTDLTGRGRPGSIVGGHSATSLPNGDPAVAFNGHGQYLRFANRPAFRIASKGVLTAEYWIRPDTLQFSDEEGSGYVYILGKGDPGRHEWYARMYSEVNRELRPNRLSGYAFKPSGGLGSGSYFQDPVAPGAWIHITLVVNTNKRTEQYPMGYVKIYKNGELRDQDSLADYDIRVRSGSAPLRIGTGYLDSFFEGAVGNVALYRKELAPKRIRAHTEAMQVSARR